ncbi:MAG: cupin [Proteobacteria bacterium]|nr:cupin [Pseudomonadota bacterium]
MKISRSVVIAAVVAMSGALSPSVFSADTPVKGDFISIKASELKWVDAPSLGPKAKVAVLEGDLKSTEPFTMRAKLPPKLTIGVHTHPTTERVTVLSGVLYFSLGDKIDPAKATIYRPGDAFMVPAGASMYAFTKDKETIIQIHGTGPWGIDYQAPADESKTKK